MSDQNTQSELTPSYRTLDEPTKLLGFSVGQIGALVVTIGLGYLLLLVSPLPWRLNFTIVVALGGGPVILLLLREQGALSSGRLVGAITRWRFRPALILPVPPDQAAPDGAVHLDEPGEAAAGNELDRELAYMLGEDQEAAS